MKQGRRLYLRVVRRWGAEQATADSTYERREVGAQVNFSSIEVEADPEEFAVTQTPPVSDANRLDECEWARDAACFVPPRSQLSSASYCGPRSMALPPR